MGNFLYTLIIYPLYLIIELIYSIFYKLTDNKGLSVIAVSIGITLLCLPLYAVAEHWQQVERDIQKKMKPGLDRIKKAFSGDERYMMTQTFYKEHKYSPIMALRSSFGLLIQIPFFMAAYSYLSNLESLKGVSFLFIKDMGVQDATFHIGSFPINVLPIAMTLINMIAGAIYTKGLALREKIQVHGMALVFLIILYNSPSGLVLYWTMNNVFSMIKNIFYKLKNPIKSFWISCCAVLAIASIYVFTRHYQTIIKLGMASILIFVFCMPLIVKFCKWLLDTFLAKFTEDKKIKFNFFLASCIVLAILNGLTIPTSLISSSPVEFADIGGFFKPTYYIYNTFLQSVGFFVFWPICIYLLFNKRVKSIISIFMGFFAISAILNTFVFNLSYGDISSSLIFLNQTSFKTISVISVINLAALFAVLVLIVILLKIDRKNLITPLVFMVALALGVSSVINIVNINKTISEYETKKDNEVEKITPIYALSKQGQNVILLMLDRAQSHIVKDMINEHPDLNEMFSGFTLFENTLSFNGHTLQGAPGIYGGYEYTPLEMNKRSDVPLVEKHNESLLLLSRLFNEQKGWTSTMADPSWSNYQPYTDLSILNDYPNIKGYQTNGIYSSYWMNHSPDAKNVKDNTGALLKRNLFMFSTFRAMPICLREIIYKKGNYWNTKDSNENFREILNCYSALDYLPELTSYDESIKGSYTFIVNELTHKDIYLGRPDYKLSNTLTNKDDLCDDSSYSTQMAAFLLVGKWLETLKANGVYDNTRIIIVSDHGCRGQENYFEKDDALDNEIHGKEYSGRGHYHPLLFFKDFNSNGNVKYDDTFMTNADTPSLLLNGLIENPINPFTQKAIPLDTTPLKENGVIISINDNHKPIYNGKYKFTIEENEWWRVRSPIKESKSWTQEKNIKEIAY